MRVGQCRDGSIRSCSTPVATDAHLSAKHSQHKSATAPGHESGPARAMELIRRFRHAEQLIDRMRTVGKQKMYTMTKCPEKFSLGQRSTVGQLVPDYVGNTCEPWIARFSVIMLDSLLDTGASTACQNPA